MANAAMEQALAPTLAKEQGGEPNPVDTAGLCLLSLDGGGVRGLSMLYTLKELMTQLNQARQAADLPSVKPCEVFDLIGGTSTGGYAEYSFPAVPSNMSRLIAIMLGPLEMDVDECISAYNELMKAVFEEKSSWLLVSWMGRTTAQFDSNKLRSAIEEVIRNKGASTADVFNDRKLCGCRT
jgi:Patatin-like phospholipase